jgi:hypothetical protein
MAEVLLLQGKRLVVAQNADVGYAMILCLMIEPLVDIWEVRCVAVGKGAYIRAWCKSQ